MILHEVGFSAIHVVSLLVINMELSQLRPHQRTEEKGLHGTSIRSQADDH